MGDLNRGNHTCFFPFLTVHCIFEKITDITFCPFYNMRYIVCSRSSLPSMTSTKYCMINLWRDLCSIVWLI